MAIGAKAIWEFADALKQSFSTPSDTRAATVQSVDNDGTVWVVYPGASSPTPIASVGAAVEPGDYVYTQLLNGRLVLTTNKSDPASGVNRARQIANSVAQPIQRAVVIAKGIADEAKAVANAINQHFWTDDNGAHVTDVTQDEWKAAVDDGFSDLSDQKPYYNQLSNSLGILLRSGLNNLASWTRSAIAFYDGEGNEAANIVARFGLDGAQIGKNDSNRLELGAASLKAYDADGNLYFNMSPSGLTADQIDVNDDLRKALLQVADLIIGDTNGAYINANGSHMSFMNGGNEVAYIDVDLETGEAVFYMTRSIVVEDMQFGNGLWKWYKRSNNNMSLKWMGGV